MKKTWFSMLAVLALALAVVSPVFAATQWDLNIHNNTEEDVRVYLYGPDDYSFTVIPGKTAKTVLEGTYEFKYSACGVHVTGTIEVKDDLTWLYIQSCSAEPEYAKFVVNSHMGDPLTLTLTGPQSYSLSITLGENKFPFLQTGYYTFTYTACGGEQSGLVRITKNGQAELTLYSCEVLPLHPQGEGAYLAAIPPSNLRIGSQYSFPVRITLFGPIDYSFVAELGLNRFNVWPGYYTFSYTAYGRTVTGSFIVPTDGAASFIISPLH